MKCGLKSIFWFGITNHERILWRKSYTGHLENYSLLATFSPVYLERQTTHWKPNNLVDYTSGKLCVNNCLCPQNCVKPYFLKLFLSFIPLYGRKTDVLHLFLIVFEKSET